MAGSRHAGEHMHHIVAVHHRVVVVGWFGAVACAAPYKFARMYHSRVLPCQGRGATLDCHSTMLHGTTLPHPTHAFLQGL